MTTKSISLLVALVALAIAPEARAVDITPYAWQFPQASNIIGADELIQRLRDEVQLILDAGHLRPLQPYTADIPRVEKYVMYNEPFRIVTTLAWAYPYLTPAQQTAAKAYVATELNTLAYTPWRGHVWDNALLPYDLGASRDGFPRDRVIWAGTDFQLARPTIQVYYGLWLFAYRSGDWATVQAKWSNIKGDYNGRVSDGTQKQGDIYGSYCSHIGVARLANKFNDTNQRATSLANLQTVMDAGVSFATVETNAYNKTSYWVSPYHDMWDARRQTGIYLGFAFLNVSPEVGRYLNDNVRTDVLTRHNSGLAKYPLWWVRHPMYACRWSGDEGIGFPSEMMGMVFPIERWVVGTSAATLRKYMRSSPTGIGDCYWLESLVTSIEAHGTVTWIDVRTGLPAAAPAALALGASVKGNQIVLTWAGTAGGEPYRVERRSGDGTWAQLATTASSEFSDNTAAAGNMYMYRVALGMAYSNEVSAAVPGRSRPAPR